MKKAFTLVEMLVVVVVIVTLMTMTFRLSSIGDDSRRRNETLSRMNRIENCLSGYYAAFGGYPPVALHGTRNIYAKVSGHGIQSEDQENKNIFGWNPDNLSSKEAKKQEAEAWEQVKAACKSQPVDCRFPFPAESEYNILVKSVSDALKKHVSKSSSGISEERKESLLAGFDNGVTDNMGRHDPDEVSWQRSQLFKFGLMSYLLPRYLVMMNSDEDFFGGQYRQWENNNVIPCNPLTGYKFNGWKLVRERSRSTQGSQLAEVANIPSQAMTARWMPNLAGICSCNHSFNLFGISIKGDAGELRADNEDIEVYSPGGYSDSGTANQYVLDSITVFDGWYHEFYYYSPPPHQTYTLWSAGPNNRTFPPWISRKTLDTQANKCVGYWIKDDLVRLNH